MNAWQMRFVALVTNIEKIGSLMCRIFQKFLVLAILGMFTIFSYCYVDDLFSANFVRRNRKHLRVHFNSMEGAKEEVKQIGLGTQLAYLIIGIILLYNLVYNYVMANRVGPGTPTDIPELVLDQHHISKKCKKCAGRKPVRTHHCSICDQCVLQMDHHCPWLGVCIGHHNRRYFLKFLTYLTFVSLLVVLLIVNLELPKSDVFIFMLVIFIIIGVFTLFHWTIALFGITTLELCEILDGYKRSKSISTNFQIIFGTRNIILSLLPYYFPLTYYGCEWNQTSYHQVLRNEVDDNSIQLDNAILTDN